MFVITNTIKVKKGYAEKMASRPSQSMVGIPGFISMDLLVKRRNEEDCEEVIVWSKWESQKAHNEFVASEHFKKMHNGVGGDHILDFKLSFYDVVRSSSIDEQQQNVI